jgi:hypothetical protein
VAKIGRPKGSKNKPKWLKEALEAQKPKRGRGRPKGSKNKPKTVPDMVAQALSEPLEKPQLPPEPPKRVGGGNPRLNDVPPEERTARARKAALARIEKCRELGVPTRLPKGWTVKHALVVQEMAKEDTKRMIDIMADAGVLPEDEGAQEAMGTVLGIMRSSQSADMKLKAARTVLEYTKAKPTQKSEVTVKPAEAFLDELADEESAADEA